MSKADIFESLPLNLRKEIEKTAEFPLLYSKVKRGSIEKEHYWKITVSETDQRYGVISIVHADVGGNEGEPTTEVIKVGKNIGKKSETTPFEQAFKEGKSRFAKKYKSSYLHEDVIKKLNLAEREQQIFPMLAVTYDDDKDQLSFPAAASPKLDGLRCLANYSASDKKVSLYTRDMTEIMAYPKIKEELEAFCAHFKIAETVYLDGEIFTTSTTFEKISGYTRIKDLSDLNDDSKKEMNEIHYHIFDIFDMDKLDSWSFKTRYSVLRKYLTEWKLKTEGSVLDLVPVYQIESKDQIFSYLDKMIKDGYEGLILRNFDSQYKISKGHSGRSRDLIKLKKSDKEFVKIMSISRDINKTKKPIVFECQDRSGLTFNITASSGTDEYHESFFKDKESYLGKSILILFDSRTKNGKPRFARPALAEEKFVIE